MKLINYFKNKFKKKMKIEIGKEYKIIKTPDGKQSSGALGTNGCQEVIGKITRKNPVVNSSYNGAIASYSMQINSLDGQPYCYNCTVYDYELAPSVINMETIETEIKEAKEKIEELKTRIQDCEDKKKFLTEQGIEEFSDEEFKAYQVLKVMGIDDINKAKQITKILGR